MCGILDLKSFENVSSVNGIVEDAENIINGEIIHDGMKRIMILQSKSGICSVLQTATLEKPMTIEKLNRFDLKLIGFLRIAFKPALFEGNARDFVRLNPSVESALMVYPEYSKNVFIFSDIEGKTIREIPFSKQVV